MVWIFLTMVLLIAVIHPGFRLFLYWTFGIIVGYIAIGQIFFSGPH